ncbi:Peptide deformylase [subsurface metagenome]
MRELVKLPNALLRQKSKPVKRIDSKIKALASEMVQFIRLRQADDLRPIGLTACELGELVRVIAFSRNPMSTEEDIQVLINPELVYAKSSHLVTESCLSIPDKEFTLRRHKIVKIRGLTLDGELRSFRGRGLLAQVFQHEIDHLDGILLDQIGERRKNR